MATDRQLSKASRALIADEIADKIPGSIPKLRVFEAQSGFELELCLTLVRLGEVVARTVSAPDVITGDWGSQCRLEKGFTYTKDVNTVERVGCSHPAVPPVFTFAEFDAQGLFTHFGVFNRDKDGLNNPRFSTQLLQEPVRPYSPSEKLTEYVLGEFGAFGRADF